MYHRAPHALLYGTTSREGPHTMHNTTRRWHTLQLLTAYELRHGRQYRQRIAEGGLPAVLAPYGSAGGAVPAQRGSMER